MFGTKVKTDDDGLKDLLGRRLEHIYPSQEEAYKKFKEDNSLKVYLGIDPTAPELHIGHTIPLLFLKKLGELGHQPVIVIGDFTARIGDPTDKEATRRAQTEKEVKDNAKDYLNQIYKILPKGSFEVKYNASWLSKMSFEDVIKLASHVTVQQMISRDMFQERIKNEKPIGIHEFLYPLMQGYDSVAMKIDGEVGGNDQTFNMLVGREIEKEYLGKDKLVFATKLLVGSSGKKMSKSEGELVAINDQPQEIRRKILMTDDTMTKIIFELCTEKPLNWIEQNQGKNPREWKEELADELVRMYHGEKAVTESRKPRKTPGGLTVVSTTVIAGIASSLSRAKELINEGAVEVNGKTVKEWNFKIKKGDILKVGKGIEIEIDKIIE